MRKFKLFSMLAMLLLCTAGMRAATEYGYGYFSARDKYPKASAEISFLNSQAQDEGKLPGAFSVSATKKVWFSQGNLQYQASTGTWRFAENQWDKYANASEGGNQTAEADRATQEKWIDLFGFGTSGYDGKNPYMCSTTENNYVHENISGTNYDWGANAISNGGNTANIWRTLTYEEMKYLISERPNATNLMAKATISYGGIFYSGCMFLPDEWAPNGVEVYNGKTYFDADWDILVKQGAVFLPGGGFREGTSVYFNSNSGSYWTGTFDNYDNAWDFYFSRNGNPYWEKSSIVRGASVRLVSEIPHSDPTEYAALVTAPTPISGLKYNGEEQAWVTPGTATGGAIFYRIDQDGEWSYQTPTSDKAGTHTIYYKVIGDATHLSPEGIFSFEVKIEKGDITVVDAANCIPGAFTISNSGRKVFFSKGNLQYNAAQGKWRFAENQWDTIGAANANISESYNGWIDLFGRGTSGYNNSYPYLSSTEAEDYAAGEGSYNLTGEYAKYDWGIYNTEQLGDGWHLNSAMEISYLLDERSDPDGESWSGEKMRAPASINGINGIILLPDGITNDTVGLENNGWDAQYSDNALTLEQWQQLEQKYYAVFLPATGKREGTTVSKVNEYAEYWENSYEDDINGHTIWVAADGSYSGGMTGFARGCAVRLTCDGLAPIAIKGLEYNGNDQVLIEPGYCAYGTFEYSLNGEAGPWITELPTGLKPGEYTVHYRVIGDESHNDLPYAANRHVVTTITGAAEIMPAAVEGLIYNGAPQTLCTAGEKEGFTFQYKVGEDGEWSTELPAETNAGTYTVYYKATNGNVEEDISGSFDVTIAKAEPTFTKPTATEPTYTGEPQALAIDGVSDDGTFQFSLDSIHWVDSIPTATDAGDYTVYYRFEGDSNHVDVSDDAFQFTVTIAKGEPEFTAPLPNELTYSGAPQSLISAGTTDDGKLLYSLDGENWSDTIPTGADAGEYTVYYKVQGDKNHVDVPFDENNKVIVTIAKADPALTAPTDLSVVFNGSAQTLIAAGTTEDGTFEYSLDGENWSTDLPTAINVGTYTVYYRVIGDENHNDSAPATITATIVKEAPGYTAPTATEPTYSGAPQPLLTAGATEDGTFLYSLDGENWSTDIPTATNAGTYTVYYKVQGDADHRDSEPATITVTIAKATLSVEDVKVVIAKFADGDSTAAVTDNGKIIGVQGNDSIVLTTTAAYDDAEVGENKTITVVYVLTADSATLANYEFPTDTEVYTHEGVIIEPMTPDQEAEPESEEKEVKEGIEINAFGFCHGEQYSLGYHLKSGNPNQYKITFSDSRFTPVPWTDLVINGTSGRDGYIDIDVPIDLPTGEYSMTVVFRDSIHFSDGTDMFLESQPFTTSFIVNLPETYTMPIFNDVIALVDTCHCLTDIQWYHRESPTDPWEPVPGATGYYLEKKGGLTGEYFAHVKMNGVETYTCPQTDVVTLYGDDTKVNVAPNPVISTATVTIENSKKTEHDLQITHLNGWIVEQNTFEGDRTTIDMSGCMVGQYMITVDGIVVKVIKK